MRYSTRMVFFTLFFITGVWMLQQQAILPAFVWSWLLLGFPLALLIPTKPKIWWILRAILIASLSCMLGFYHAAWHAQQRLSVQLPDEWQGRDIEVIGVVAELPHPFQRGLHFSFDVETVLTPAASVPPHIYLSTYNEKATQPLALHAGERWQLTVRLKQPHGGSNPHGSDFEIWALENNVRALGYIHNKGNNIRLDSHIGKLSYRIESWRESMRDKFNTTLANAPYSGVLAALAIGDQSSIPRSQWQVFTRTGVNHLMSI